MAIKLYNTLSRRKEELQTIEQGSVKMYVCGPTVYNYIHIGNARAFTMFDVVRHYLQYRGYQVTYIQNFTDVDDKLINKAQEEGTTVAQLADKYITAYFADADALGIQRADCHPRVTEHIREIIDFVEQLIVKGYAYERDGDVYFDTEGFENYGKLSQQDLEELKSGARIEIDLRKKNPLDFALWKSAKGQEITWDSPWGKGRPGWHIECSAMAKKYLGETIDIHAGGQDLVFPHHENEVAQSEALNQKPFANYWMHNGYINIDNKKMSKSLGNVMIVHELRKAYDPDVLRFFLVSAHYRSPINFSEELLGQAANGLERIRIAYENLQHRMQIAVAFDRADKTLHEERASYVDRFQQAMDDDFNTAEAFAVVYDIVKEANIYLRNETTDADKLAMYSHLLEEFLGVFRIPLQAQAGDNQLTDEDVNRMISERQQARADKNFAKADQIRQQLLAEGILLEDTAQGARWKRVKKI